MEVNSVGYDYSRLAGKIVEVFGTQAKFAEAVGLSERSVSLKLNNKLGWKQVEMTKACSVLGVDLAEVARYFFTPKVQNI